MPSCCRAASSGDTIKNIAVASAVSETDLIPERLKALKTDCRGGKLEISSAVAAALKQWNPGFVVWEPDDYDIKDCLDWSFRPSRTGPGQGTGDFNGDGRADFIFAGHDEKIESLAVVLSSGSVGFIVVPICSSLDSGEELVTDCSLLYKWSLDKHPYIAVYRVLPRGTWFSGYPGPDAEGTSFILKRDAFIAARADHKFGTTEKSGFIHQSPFASLQMFQWIGHEDKRYQKYIKSGGNPKVEFISYFASSIHINGMREERLPEDTEGY